jgi:hypothetical protein
VGCFNRIARPAPGCHAAARQLYDDALRTFGAPAYAELRLRAQFAIAYITRNAAKWAPAPAQAASAHLFSSNTVERKVGLLLQSSDSLRMAVVVPWS